jgi:predicted RNA polymerase sigma factor
MDWIQIPLSKAGDVSGLSSSTFSRALLTKDESQTIEKRKIPGDKVERRHRIPFSLPDEFNLARKIDCIIEVLSLWSF